MTRSLLAAVLSSFALLAACGDANDTPEQRVEIGAPIDPAELCQVQLGVSTTDEVTERFGAAPLAGAASGEMPILLQYVYVDLDGVVRESTLFWFDEVGVLQRVERVLVELPACLQPPQ